MLIYSAAAAALVGFAAGSSSHALSPAPVSARRRWSILRGRHSVRRPLVPPQKQGFALGIYGMGNIGTAVAAFSIPGDPRRHQ